MVILYNFIFVQQSKGQSYTENEIKAAYIKNIIQFVTWPENKDVTREFIIVLTGKSEFNIAFENFFKNMSINDRTIKIITIYNPHNIINCDILFINKTSKDKFDNYIKKAILYNSLVISDSEGYAKKGSHINFYIENQKVKFEINLTKAVDDGFYIQSLLLDYAKIITTKKEN